MLPTLIIFFVVIAAMIASILLFPRIKIGKLSVGTYWIIVAVGAIIMLATGLADIKTVGSALSANTAVNPLKILALFIAMTVLSVFLDELGFFAFVANAALKRAGSGQFRLFVYLYITVSALTVFTSNDIIILSFTPFICYFAKEAKISAIPYLAAEFVAANTWSTMLIIGNPTNIYLATAYGIDFFEYIKINALPTLAAGLVAFGMLTLLFWKKLREPISGEAEEAGIKDKFLLWVGIAHLAAATVMLAVSSYIGVEMWIVSVAAVGSLFVFALIDAAVRRKKPVELLGCLKRAPYQLVPFVLSMFIMIVALDQNGITAKLSAFFGDDYSVIKYGTLSFLTCNVINNIPMSVLFSSIISGAGAGYGAVFSTIIASNLGAFLTPIGALAGIMWSSILEHHDEKFTYLDFLKMGAVVAVPALLAALGTLQLILLAL